ncbi:MAG TPA: amidohydrolase [Holophaga sp.]|nr:amidohydrolase [Holophaga sp.]HPS67950.1 amidohydrolase [Holophaga sp.]
MTLLIHDTFLGGSTKDILVEGDRITRISDRIEAPRDCEVLEARGMAAVPSLVNGHGHASMVLLRGIAEDMELMPWLTEAIWPIEGRMTGEDAYWGLRLAALEMIRTGTTLCSDMYFHPLELARAARDSGMRFVLSYVLLDGLDEELAHRQRVECEAFFDHLPDCGPLSRFILGGHSVYATSPGSLRFLGELSRAKKLPLHVHLAETEAEDQGCRSRTRMSPAAFLDSLGALGPLTLAAHCLWLDEADFDLLAERGVAIVHNPVSNMKLASGPAFDYAAARKRGIRVLLGTDGAASNNALDLFSDMKVAGLLQKHHYRDPRRFPVAEILEAASRTGHDWFGTGGGRIEEGATADLLLVDLRRLGMSPCHDLASNLVYSGAGAAVDTTVCAGRILMRGGVVPGSEEILAEATARARALAGREPVPT